MEQNNFRGTATKNRERGINGLPQANEWHGMAWHGIRRVKDKADSKTFLEHDAFTQAQQADKDEGNGSGAGTGGGGGLQLNQAIHYFDSSTWLVTKDGF